MNRKAHRIFLTAGTLLLMAVFSRASQAAVRCETQYGGGEACVKTGELQIDKKVFNPDTREFVDNLGLSVNIHRFAPGEEIVFKFVLKNVGDNTFDRVLVSDTLPDFVELVSGSTSFEIRDLTPGESEEREIRVRVVGADRFPDGRTVCVVNAAEAVAGDERDRDTSQVCLQEKVLGAVTVLPRAGFENWMIFPFSALSVLIGISLLRFSRRLEEGR